MNNTVAIIIPLYKKSLSQMEMISVHQCFQVLSNHKIIAVKPDNLSLDNYQFSFDEVVSFEERYFENITGYNELMLSPVFYSKFLAYTFVLIYQPDSFVFKDELQYWCDKNYDYIGAPWLRYAPYPDVIKRLKNQVLSFIHYKLDIRQKVTKLPTSIQFENRVGNGGFSLRKTAIFHEISLREKETIASYIKRNHHFYNEDAFWGIEVNRKNLRIRIPDYKTAIFFSFETYIEHGFLLTKGELPFGCHAWDRYYKDWEPVFKELNLIK